MIENVFLCISLIGKLHLMKDILLQRSLSGIGQQLLTCRHARQDKQLTVARSVGISVSVLSRVESGKYKHVTIELLLKLAGYYGVTIEEIVSMSN